MLFKSLALHNIMEIGSVVVSGDDDDDDDNEENGDDLEYFINS